MARIRHKKISPKRRRELDRRNRAFNKISSPCCDGKLTIEDFFDTPPTVSGPYQKKHTVTLTWNLEKKDYVIPHFGQVEYQKFGERLTPGEMKDLLSFLKSKSIFCYTFGVPCLSWLFLSSFLATFIPVIVAVILIALGIAEIVFIVPMFLLFLILAAGQLKFWDVIHPKLFERRRRQLWAALHEFWDEKDRRQKFDINVSPKGIFIKISLKPPLVHKSEQEVAKPEKPASLSQDRLKNSMEVELVDDIEQMGGDVNNVIIIDE